MSNEQALREELTELLNASDNSVTATDDVAAMLRYGEAVESARAAIALPASAHGAEPVAWMRAGANRFNGYEACHKEDVDAFAVYRAAPTPAAGPAAFTYSSTQATECAGCGQRKHTPLRVDAMGGYVCLTCIDTRLEELLDAAQAAQAGAVPKGFKLVPVEPTDAMILAGAEAESNDGKTYLRPAWRYMLAAAPSLPAPAQPDAADAAHGPMTEAPEVESRYWVLNANGTIGFDRWVNDEQDHAWLREGRLFRTEADARATLAAQAVAKGGDRG